MKKIQIVGLVLIALAIGFIIYSSRDSYSEYTDFATAKDNADSEYHVVGYLDKSKAQKYDPLKDPNYFEFEMRDEKGNESTVIYHGAKPDGFDQTEKIVVAGSYKAGHFSASQILMKCPSKYVDQKADVS